MAILIALDAGHGSNTAGKRTPKLKKDTDLAKKGEQLREHVASVWVCNFAKAYLEKYGFEVMRTAWNDTNARDDPDVPLIDRQNAIRKAGAVVSVSCHFNAHGNGNVFTDAAGIETFISDTDKKLKRSKALATAIQERLKKLGRKDRGVKRGDLAMCNADYMKTEGSVLVELGFMTNESEAVLMGSKKYLKDCGHFIALGIYDFLCKKPKADIDTKTATREEIMWLQVKLNLKGYQTPTTGKWDEDLINSIKAFWKDTKERECTGKVVKAECIKLLSM